MFIIHFLIEGVVYDRIIGHVLAQASHFILCEIEASEAILTSPETIVGTRVHTLYGIQKVLIAELRKVLAESEVHFDIVHNA